MTRKYFLFFPLIIFLLLFSDRVFSQTYVRTHKNIGILGSVYFPDQSKRKGSTSGTNRGVGYGIGLTYKLRDIFYPELFFVNHSNSIFRPDTGSTWASSHVSSNSLGAGILIKQDLFSIDNKKKNGYCFGRVLNLLLGSELVFPLSTTKIPGLNQKTEFAGKIGMGIYSIWGGSSKNHRTWVIHWEIYYRKGFTPYLRTDFGLPGNNKYTLSSLGVTLRIMHFKTYKFSDM